MVGDGIRKSGKIIMKKFILLPLIILIAGCSNDMDSTIETSTDIEETFNWRLVTSWPKNYPGLGMAPERIADLVEEMSDGQMKITVYGAEEQVPAFGVFDAVSSGAHQMGHSGGYFWKGKVPALSLIHI